MLRTITIVSILLAGLASAAEPTTDDHRVIYRATGTFDDYREDISDAILGMGMVISNVSHVGEMLSRTGKDLGAGKAIFNQAEVIEFCHAINSRRAMAADPHNIVFCPFRIAVYSLTEAPEQVYIAFPRLKTNNGGKSQGALDAVEDMLRAIIEEVVD